MEKSKSAKLDNNDIKKITKPTQEEILNQISLKSIEKDCLDRVYKLLCELQEQPSSDDDNKQKKYLLDIEKKANQKKMKLVLNKDKNKTSKSRIIIEKRYKEEENNPNGSTIGDNVKRIGVKAVRKILKKLEQEVPKEEMQLMIWVILLTINKSSIFPQSE